MKFKIPKPWLLKRAPLEEGREIGAGKPCSRMFAKERRKKRAMGKAK